MAGVNHQSAQNGGVNISGNDNVVAPNATTLQVFPSGKPLTKTAIYNLLCVFQSTCPKSSDDTLEKPMPFKGKLRYNGVRRYHQIFDSYSVEYGYLDGMLQDFADSNDIIRQLGTIFVQVAECDEDGNPVVSDGDAVLDKIKEQLIGKITGSLDFDRDKYRDIDIEKIIYALMACGVHRCKVLVNENRVKRGNN